MDRIIVVSGYFNPIHAGHIDYLQAAKKLGNRLVVIVNNDLQVTIKGSQPFMALEERLTIVSALGVVDDAVPSIDTDGSVKATLRSIWNTYVSNRWVEKRRVAMTFANGGDRHDGNVPEYDLCEELGISLAFNVGGEKTQSSSNLLNRMSN